MTTSELWIGGKAQKPSTGEYFDDLNPSNLALIARVAKGSAADVDAAVNNAKETFEHFKDAEVRQREKSFVTRLPWLRETATFTWTCLLMK